MTHRLKPLLLTALALGLGACAPKPQFPATPPQQPQRPAATQPIAPEAAGTPRLQEAVETAADLFNRGENELACEQVKRAEGVKGSASAADQELTNRLEQYRQACEPD